MKQCNRWLASTRAPITGLVLLMWILTGGCRSAREDPTAMTVRDVTVPPRASDPATWLNPHEPEISPAVRPLLGDHLSAEDAVQVALYNNRAVQARIDALDRAAARALEARLLKNPELDASVIFSEEDSSDEVIEAGLEFDLLHLLLLPRRAQLGQSRYNVARLELVRAIQSVAYDTRVAYYRLLAAHEQLELRRRVLAAADAGQAMAQRLREAGNIKQLDLLTEQSLAEQARLQLPAAVLNVTQAREALHVQMGAWGSATNWTVTNALPRPPQSLPNPDAAVTNALRNSIALASLREQIRAAAEQVGIARIESAVPTLHLGVEAEREPDGLWLVGPMVAVEIPVFNFGQAARPAARAELRRLWQRYAEQVVLTRSALRRATARVAASAERVRQYRDTIIPLQKKILHRTRLQYNAMQIGVFQLLQAKQADIAARSAYINELLAYWTARIELDQLRNGLMTMPSGSLPGDGGPGRRMTEADNGH